MITKAAVVCVVVFTFVGGLAAAENPFVGTWKLNPVKSKFAVHTMKFEKGPSGAIRYSEASLTYTFKVDGKEYAGPMGEVIVWRQIDDHTWETTNTLKGRLFSTDTSQISPDGKSMTVVSKGSRLNGETFQNTTIYERISGQSGLLGGWRRKEVKISSPETVEFKPFGEDGLMYRFDQDTCDVKFDGKDYPCNGPTMPAGATLAFTRKGPRSIEYLFKQNRKPVSRGTQTVSQDGHTQTFVGGLIGADEPSAVVYDRQ